MSYEDDASSRVKENNPLTPKPDNSWMKSLPEVDAMPRFRPTPQPQPEAARCGECFHPDSRDEAGFCQHPGPIATLPLESMPCSCRCTFPAPEAPAVAEGESPLASCAICGGKRVRIRGRFPREPQREVCPTCLAERMEQIHEITGMKYGAADTSHDQ